jgi:hypothetical protein
MLKEQIVKLLSLVALLVASGWNGANPSWASVVTFLTLLAAYVAAEVRQVRKLRALRYNKVDLSLFRQFLSLFDPSSGCLQLLKCHDFGGSFKSNELDPVREFRADWHDSQHEFVDKRLEAKKQALHAAVDAFMDLLAANVFSEGGNPEWLSMELSNRPSTPGLEERQEQINALAAKAYKAVQDFVRTGRKTFRVVRDL